MAHKLTCPSCQADLRIPKRLRQAELTCPHCLAKVPNPGVAVRTTAPTGGPAGEAATEAPQANACPECGQAVQTGWRFCPFCKVELERPSAPTGILQRLPEAEQQRVAEGDDVPDVIPLEAEVRSDVKVTTLGLSLLLVVGLVVLCLLAAAGAWPLALLVLVGCSVVGVLALVWLRPASEPADVSARADRGHSSGTVVASTATGILGGCALGAAVASLIIISLLVAALAAIGNAIETCLTCGNPPPKKSEPLKK